ncbi:GH36-type glycosyl hydrolase domain-containing protein [Rhizobium grahamii]|uniref:Cellobiose phosphorylase n=1 Tax=Rhizobium grahamii TaxID=1120045 RepID=A0A370KK40_9HYPH|nr:cellobiose phosphorylase [Rhizobium grahamii]RDJ05835.1 cellobiose phosphorylase [Rhizobium grahamii]
MASAIHRRIQIPRRDRLGLVSLSNDSGLSISLLPNGTLFAIEYNDDFGAMMVNQVFGSPVYGGIGRLYLRISGSQAGVFEIVGPRARISFSRGETAFFWNGQSGDIRHSVQLELHSTEATWFWQVTLENLSGAPLEADLVLVQDVGIGNHGFLMGSEAYASQYIDHTIANHPVFGPVVMNRQNLKQPGDRNPWLAHGCATGAAAYATDAIQLVFPRQPCHAAMVPDFGNNLPAVRRQHELACPAIQSTPLSIGPGVNATATFFGLFVPDHSEPSSDKDIARLDGIQSFKAGSSGSKLASVSRSLLQDVSEAVSLELDDKQVEELYPRRCLEERMEGKLLSFFIEDGLHNRHVVLQGKEIASIRRHGAIVRSGQNMLPGDNTLAATCWMQGIFAAQLTIGNPSFHKLFSVSRDPYNLTVANGLRILVDEGDGWRLLGTPSAFEMGLSDCRWLYRLPGRTITIMAAVSGEDPAMQWQITSKGAACRFLVFGHLTLGEREFESAGRVDVNVTGRRITFSPDATSLWGQKYPAAAYHLITSMPELVEAIGGDELLYTDRLARGGPFIVLEIRETHLFRFAVTGSMVDAKQGEELAKRYEVGVDLLEMLTPAAAFWNDVTRNIVVQGDGPDLLAHTTFLPWLAHDAIIHASVPHGLEQFTGAAWGTRDVCQGPVELLLAFEHDNEVRDILQILFGEQFQDRGDWPQWFMLEPYSNIRAGESHGDIIVWPLKALCDYIEATGDIAILEVAAPWRADDTLEHTEQEATIFGHVEKLFQIVQERFIPGTNLVRYGEGDWNDSLQPADPHLRDWMVSSWTVALLYEQVARYAVILAGAGHATEAAAFQRTAAAMRQDFNDLLIRDNVVAGYGILDPDGNVELLLHPDDRRTGLHYSLISMTQPILGGLFTPEQTARHLTVIKENLLFPDGARLMEKAVRYSGGTERLFRRAESSAFFGREIGLMYTHAHLRYCEALALQGDADGLWKGLALANPVAISNRLPQASLRQRNTYFSSSDAAFSDRYKASSDWNDLRSGRIAVDGGWRIYSSGAGIFTKILIERAFGFRREFGQRVHRPLLPEAVTARAAFGGAVERP